MGTVANVKNDLVAPHAFQKMVLEQKLLGTTKIQSSFYSFLQTTITQEKKMSNI